MKTLLSEVILTVLKTVKGTCLLLITLGEILYTTVINRNFPWKF